MPYPEHFEVDCVQTAVALAERLQAEGLYDIFRGQTTDWPMRASFCRRSPPERKEAEARFLEFAGFVHATPELASLRGDRFGIMAIAQHYQIPTVLVDFTSQAAVAGWFASHGDAPKAGRGSILYMAKEERLVELYRERLSLLHTLRVSVENLWRLQAQAGLFLHLPFDDNPELDLWLSEGFGSIKFPYTGPLDQIPESAIYPDRKSRLEILFDGFTSEQNLRIAQKKIRELGMRIIPPSEPAPDRPAPAFLGDRAPPPHSSWNPTRLKAWLRPTAENFRRQDKPPELVLQARPEELKDNGSSALQQRLTETVAEFLEAHQGLRSGFVNFRLNIEGRSLDDCRHPDSRQRRTVSQDLADCWDGMRLFPYTDGVIANAVAYLAAGWVLVHAGRRSLYQTFEELLGPSILVEFGLAVGGQLATVPFPKMECCSALRPDLPDLLKPESLDLQKEPGVLLHLVIEPARLFDFDRFASVFGTRLVPGQFLFRQREIVFFSPAGIERLGNR